MSKPSYTCPHCSKEYNSAVWLSKHIAEGKCLNKPRPEDLIAAAMRTSAMPGPIPMPPSRPAPQLSSGGYKRPSRKSPPIEKTIAEEDTERVNHVRELLHGALEPNDKDLEDIVIDESEDDFYEPQLPVIVNTNIAMMAFEGANSIIDAVITDGQLKPIVDERIDKYRDVIHRIQEKYGISLNGLPEVEFAVMYAVDFGKAVHEANLAEEELYSDSEEEESDEPKKIRQTFR